MERSGPSPMSIRRAGMARATRLKTSTTSGDALDGAEVGEVDEKFLIGSGEAGAHGGDQVGLADVDVAVDEVADDFDLGGDAEELAGAVAEVAGDGGDAVGLCDANLVMGR